MNQAGDVLYCHVEEVEMGVRHGELLRLGVDRSQCEDHEC